MNLELFATVFGAVFLAELGDKTQLATVLFASREGASLVTVFVAAALALVSTTGIGVLAGSALAAYVEAESLSYAAGAGFIVLGLWTLWRA